MATRFHPRVATCHSSFAEPPAYACALLRAVPVSTHDTHNRHAAQSFPALQAHAATRLSTTCRYSPHPTPLPFLSSPLRLAPPQTLFLAGTHALHFFIGLAALRTWPFHITYHAAAALAWGVVVAFALYTSRLPASIDFRALSVLAALAYLLQLYSFFRLYFDPHGLPLQYIKASIWTAMLQTVVAMLVCVLGWKRQAKSPSTNAIRAQLGIGYDELPGSETAASGSKPGTSADAAGTTGTAGGGQPGGEDGSDEDKRTWISLFWDACVYVWPEDPWLQARTIGCLGLLVCMRFINLAVPILYKRVVDTLAAASSGGGTQPRVRPGGLGLLFGLLPSGGEAVGAVADAPSGAPAGDTSFGQLVWPWVVLYLAAVFFQGGAGGGIVGFINNCRWAG